MHRSVLENAEFITWASENAIILVPHPDKNHGSVDVAKPAKGEPKKQCSLYPGLSCDEHVSAYADAAEPTADEKGDKDKKPAKADKPKKKGDVPDLVRFEVKGFPVSYLLSPDGQFEVHKADREPAPCKDGILAFQAKFDEHPIPFSKLADVRKSKDALEKSMKASNWKAAYAALVAVDKALDGKLPKSLLEAA